MNNNKLTPTDAQQLTKELVEVCTQQCTQSYELLEYIIDEYLYAIDDEQVEYIREQLDTILEPNCMETFIPGFHD